AREVDDTRPFRRLSRTINDPRFSLDPALRLRRRPDVCDGLGVRLFRERAPVVPVRERLPERCGDVGKGGLVAARLEPRERGLGAESRVLGVEAVSFARRPARPDGEQRNEAREGHGERAADGHSFALHARINSPTDATSSRICEWLTIWPP